MGYVVERADGDNLAAEGSQSGRAAQQIDQVVGHMDAQPGHTPGGTFRRVAPPAGPRVEPLRVGQVGLGVVNHPQLTGFDHLLQPPGGRLAAAVVSDLENDPGGLSRLGRPPRLGHREGEGLVDEDVFAGAGRFGDEIGMGRMGRCDHHRLDLPRGPRATHPAIRPAAFHGCWRTLPLPHECGRNNSPDRARPACPSRPACRPTSPTQSTRRATVASSLLEPWDLAALAHRTRPERIDHTASRELDHNARPPPPSAPRHRTMRAHNLGAGVRRPRPEERTRAHRRHAFALDTSQVQRGS